VKYFLATFEIFDGLHTYTGAIIFEANTEDEARALAKAEVYEPDTDSASHYFSFAGDGSTGCELRACQEISRDQMVFLERVGLAYRR
jgi:hypothetical protein